MNRHQTLCKKIGIHQTGGRRIAEIIVIHINDLIAETAKCLLLPLDLSDLLFRIVDLCCRAKGHLFDDLVTLNP